MVDKHIDEAPWMVCEEFNIIMDLQDKKVGRPFNSVEAIKLLSFMIRVGLFDKGFSGARFTWCIIVITNIKTNQLA